MNLRKLLGYRLVELLSKKKIKQYELAEKMDLDPQSISRMVSGKHFPKIEHLEKIIDILQIEPQELFTFSQTQDNDKLIEDIYKIIAELPAEKVRLVYNIVRNIKEF